MTNKDLPNETKMKDGDKKVFSEKFSLINECAVEDISLDVFYKPHTIAALLCSIFGVIVASFIRNEDVSETDNIWAGLIAAIFFLLLISILAFPNGPFTRPHPAVWRMVFGLSIFYLLALLFLLFQNYETAKHIINWFDPKLKDFRIDMDKEYGVNCSDISLEKIYNHLDVFALGHFVGWAFKAVLIRHMGILWAMSIMWEVTEIAFAHLLPNFIECWWDALILDILLCNGIGIWVGLKICKWFEMREYKWVSIKDIHSTSGKLKRAMMQFTPQSWTHVRWLDPTCTHMRFIGVCQMVLFWQLSELNTFFLKHIFEMPPSHPIVIIRLTFLGIMVAPSARQYYSFVTDTQCKRLGTQCWIYGAIQLTEALLCIKNGKLLFGRTQAFNILVWLSVMFLLAVLCVYGCVLWHRYVSSEDCGGICSQSTTPSKGSLASRSNASMNSMGEPLLGDSDAGGHQKLTGETINSEAVKRRLSVKCSNGGDS